MPGRSVQLTAEPGSHVLVAPGPQQPQPGAAPAPPHHSLTIGQQALAHLSLAHAGLQSAEIELLDAQV